MAEASFVKNLMQESGNKGGDSEPHEAWRRAFWIENAGGGNPFSVSIRYSDGRSAEGFSPGLYLRHQWLDRGGKTERLVWIFNNGGIYLEGHYLQRGLDALEEGKLKRITEHGESEIALINSHNRDVGKWQDKESIVLRVVVSPSFESVLESEPHLAEIAKLVKEVV